MNTYTKSSSTTFTITDARYLASKISTDMHLFGVYYGSPSESYIRDLAEELAQLMKDGYVSEYEFGFKKNGTRVVCCHYSINDSGVITTDDRPGRVVSSADVCGSSFYTFLTNSIKWSLIDESEKEKIEKSLPIQRTSGVPPKDGHGHWVSDKTYSSNGTNTSRKTFRPNLDE